VTDSQGLTHLVGPRMWLQRRAWARMEQPDSDCWMLCALCAASFVQALMRSPERVGILATGPIDDLRQVGHPVGFSQKAHGAAL